MTKKERILQSVRGWMIVILAILLIEISIGNYGFWFTRSLEPTNISEGFTLTIDSSNYGIVKSTSPTNKQTGETHGTSATDADKEFGRAVLGESSSLHKPLGGSTLKEYAKSAEATDATGATTATESAEATDAIKAAESTEEGSNPENPLSLYNLNVLSEKITSPTDTHYVGLPEPIDISTLQFYTDKNCNLEIKIFDEGNFYSTHEFTLGVNKTPLSFYELAEIDGAIPVADQPKVFDVQTYGKVKRIAIKLTAIYEVPSSDDESDDDEASDSESVGNAGDEASDNEKSGTQASQLTSAQKDRQVNIAAVVANNPIPFTFSWVRVGILLGICLLIWIYNPKRRIANTSAFEVVPAHTTARGRFKKEKLKVTHATKIGLIVTSVVLCIAMALPALLNPEYLGTMRPNASDTLDLDGQSSGQTINLNYRHFNQAENQYGDLAEAMADGQLFLKTAPPTELLELDNPYDPSRRNFSNTSDYWDLALFNGNYYVYYGVLPVILFYLPYYLITGYAFPTAIGCIIGLWAAIIGCVYLAQEIARRKFKNASTTAVLLGAALLPLGSMIIWVGRQPGIYLITYALAIACLTWGAVLYLKTDRHPWLAVPGSLLLAMIFAARPQIGAYALLCVPLGITAARKFVFQKRDKQKTDKKVQKIDKAIYVVCALLPFVIVFSLLGAYNAARFGSPLDFGANYNLTTNDMTHRSYEVPAAFSGIYYLLLQLPNVTPYFPFFDATNLSYVFNGNLISEPMLGGLLWIAPVCWFALAFFARRAKGLRWIAITTLVLVVIVASADGLMAGVLPRYQIDMAMPLTLLGVVGIYILTTPKVQQEDKETQTIPDANSIDSSSASTYLSPVRKVVLRVATACLIIACFVALAIAFYRYVPNSVQLINMAVLVRSIF